MLTWSTGATRTVGQSLDHFIRYRLPALLVAAFLIGLIPAPADFLLGNRGEPVLAIIAPLLLTIAAGLVCSSVALLKIVLWPFKLIGKRSHDM